MASARQPELNDPNPTTRDAGSESEERQREIKKRERDREIERERVERKEALNSRSNGLW